MRPILGRIAFERHPGAVDARVVQFGPAEREGGRGEILVRGDDRLDDPLHLGVVDLLLEAEHRGEQHVLLGVAVAEATGQFQQHAAVHRLEDHPVLRDREHHPGRTRLEDERAGSRPQVDARGVLAEL
ncbi:Uncharacterised protein [Mycobacteroides abscessus subsp. abscessus]|nr:Uncharacterised protein [Mycobacteroides abscessus subsp. abscessus]